MAGADSGKKRDLKCLAYIIAGVIAQTILILLFVMLVLRVRSPRVRLAAVTVSNLSVSTTSSSRPPSFRMNLDAKVTVKNTNFGHFKFGNSAVTFFYKGTSVGKATVAKARAYARSTKKLNVTVHVTSGKVKTDVDAAGTLKMTAIARLDGEVHLLKIFKKKKSAAMKCSMDVIIETSQVHNLTCK